MTLLQLLSQLEKLAKAATPGPWTEHTSGLYMDVVFKEVMSAAEKKSICNMVYGTENDRVFIATLNPETVLKLLEIVKVQSEALEFYADRENYDREGQLAHYEWTDENRMSFKDFWVDYGFSAREAQLKVNEIVRGMK